MKLNRMKKNHGLMSAVLTAAVLAPGLALAGVAVNDTLGTQQDEIVAKLEAMGYTIEEVEREHGHIEVEAMLEGVEYELEVSLETGIVTEIALEDDDDDDHNDDD